MNQDLMAFFREIICLKNRGWGICNKPSLISRCRHKLGCLFCNRSEIVYFDNFGVEHVPEKIKVIFGNKNITANIFRVQANNSVMCGYFCIRFIDFMLSGKKLTDFMSMLSPYDFKKNEGIILSHFKDE